MIQIKNLNSKHNKITGSNVIRIFLWHRKWILATLFTAFFSAKSDDIYELNFNLLSHSQSDRTSTEKYGLKISLNFFIGIIAKRNMFVFRFIFKANENVQIFALLSTHLGDKNDIGN